MIIPNIIHYYRAIPHIFNINSITFEITLIYLNFIEMTWNITWNLLKSLESELNK